MILKSNKINKNNIIDRERKLIRNYAKLITRIVKKDRFNLIDLGCGNGEKAELFIRSLPPEVKVRYYPIDISGILLKQASERIRSMNSGKVDKVKEFEVDFENIDSILGLIRSSEYQNNVCLLLGSTISSFEINDFLYKYSGYYLLHSKLKL